MAQPILYVHGMEAIGGAEQDLLSCLGHLDREAWSPTVVCPPRGDFRERIERLNIPVASLDLPPWRKLSSLFSRYTASKQLETLLQKHQPTLVHVNDLWWVPHVLQAVSRIKRDRIPLIAHVRQAVKSRKVRAYSLDRLDCVLAVSRRIQTTLEEGGVPSERIRLLYSGVDLAASSRAYDGVHIRALHGIPSEALLIGTVANLFPIKGYEIMIEALPAIIAAIPLAHYLIVGSGSDVYRRRLQQLCADKGLTERVHFAGFQDPTGPYFAAMDLYVQPSLNEAFGIAVVEAMAIGKAVVASRVGGLPEIVAHEETGLLVSPRDVAELARAIIALLEDRQYREWIGSRGLIRARERFDLKTTVIGLEQVYRDVLAKGAGLVG